MKRTEEENNRMQALKDNQPLFADLEHHRIEGYTHTGRRIEPIPLISHIKGNLYSGGCKDGAQLPDIIKFVVSAYPWEKYKVSSKNNNVNVSYNWLYDAAAMPNLIQLHALADYVAAVSKIAPTLVHCQAGLNRSGLIVCLALMKDGMTANEAINLLRSQRSEVCLSNATFEKYLLSS